MPKAPKVRMAVAKQLLRCLVRTVGFGTTHKNGGFRLNVYPDADRRDNPDNEKSTSSYIMMVCNGPVSFKVDIRTRVNGPVASKLVAGALATREAVLFQDMMTELGFKERFNCVPLHIDNTSALHVAGNQTYSSCAKQVALRYFYSTRSSRRDT